MIVVEWIARLLMVAVGLFLSFLLLALFVFGVSEGFDYAKGFVTDTPYAEAVFGGLVPYDEVLDAQRHNALTNSCVTLVVRLSDNAPENPPIRTSRPYGLNFGGDWQKGPAPWFVTVDDYLKLGKRAQSAAVKTCGKKNWDDDLYDRVKAAALDEATWWIGGNQIYSKKHKLAALVHWRGLK